MGLLGELSCQVDALVAINEKELRPHGDDDGVVGVTCGEGDAAGATWRGRRRRGPASFQRGGAHVTERAERDSKRGAAAACGVMGWG